MLAWFDIESEDVIVVDYEAVPSFQPMRIALRLGMSFEYAGYTIQRQDQRTLRALNNSLVGRWSSEEVLIAHSRAEAVQNRIHLLSSRIQQNMQDIGTAHFPMLDELAHFNAPTPGIRDLSYATDALTYTVPVTGTYEIRSSGGGGRNMAEAATLNTVTETDAGYAIQGEWRGHRFSLVQPLDTMRYTRVPIATTPSIGISITGELDTPISSTIQSISVFYDRLSRLLYVDELPVPFTFRSRSFPYVGGVTLGKPTPKVKNKYNRAPKPDWF